MKLTNRIQRNAKPPNPSTRNRPRVAMETPTAPEALPDVPQKVIQIHSSNRQRAVANLSLSTRARNILNTLGIKTLGELDGATHRQILEAKNCGYKSYEEIVRVAEAFEQAATGDRNGGHTVAPSHRTIVIPEKARAWSIDLLPLSVRLHHALQRLNCTVLGDLHGLSYGILTEMPDCGARTQTELRDFVARVQRGDFGRSRETTNETTTAFIVGKIDEFVASLPLQHRAIFMERIGASGDPVTLMSVGRKYKMTRERVRQIISMLTEKALRHGGPPLAQAIGDFKNELSHNVWPLTPALLGKMIGPSTRRPQHVLTFYIRLLGWMEPSLSVWPIGQTPAAYRTPEQERVIARIKEWFRGKSAPVGFVEAWRAINSGGFQCTAREFLEAVRFGAEIALNLEDPQNPLIHPPIETPRRWARQVLSTPNPATLSVDTLSRAKALLLSRRSSGSRYRLASVQAF